MQRLLPVYLVAALLCVWPVWAEEAPAETGTGAGNPQDVQAEGATASTAIPAQRLVVMDLQMQGKYGDQLTQWLPALLEATLAEHGWTVLARGQALEAIQQEQNLPGMNPTTAPPQNQLYAASAILQLNARVDVKDYDAAANIGLLSIGGLIKVKFHLNGQIIDAGTGVIHPLGEIQTDASKLKRLAVVFPSAGWIGGGFNLKGVQDSLVGSTADKAVRELVERLDTMGGNVPGYEAAIPVEQETIILAFPETMRPAPGAEYGIYRRDRMIAKVRVIDFNAGRATCRILAQTDQIRATDVARPLEVVVPVEVSAQ